MGNLGSESCVHASHGAMSLDKPSKIMFRVAAFSLFLKAPGTKLRLHTSNWCQKSGSATAGEATTARMGRY
jgi:hypothetical protein